MSVIGPVQSRYKTSVSETIIRKPPLTDFARWLHTAMWHVALMTVNSQNSPKRPPYWNFTSGFDFNHISAQSTCHSAPIFEILSKSDHRRHKKWRHVYLQDGGSEPSWILGANSFFEKPTSSIDSSKLLSFWENRFVSFWRQTEKQTDRRTDRRTDGQHRCTKLLSLLRAAA